MNQRPRIPLGNTIAQRIMETISGDKIVITVGAPIFVGDGWDWACPFRIDGLPVAIEDVAFGVDALQSLQLVSPAIRHTLETTNEQFQDSEVNGKSICWESGFPLFIESFGNRAVEEKILGYMGDTLTEWVRTKK